MTTDEMRLVLSGRVGLIEGTDEKSVASKLVEECGRHLNKLTRRNEEKREAIKELWSRIDRLMEGNQRLIMRQKKLVDENGALHMKLMSECKDEPKNCSIYSEGSNKQSKSQMARLKNLILSTIWGGDST